jgi:uncharacterized repeat protein (TIGR01451 family)
VNKTVYPSEIKTGEEATYSVTITNLTSYSKTIGLYDSLGTNNNGFIEGTDGGKAVLVDGSMKVSGARFTGDIAKTTGMTLYDIAPNSLATISYRVRGLADMNTTSYIANEATLFDGSTDSATLIVTGNSAGSNNPNLTIDKFADKSVVRGGETVEYTLRVVNNGKDDATSVNIYDALPSNLKYISSPNYELNEENGNLSVNVGTLAPGESRVIKYFAKVDNGVSKGDLIENVAQVTYKDTNNVQKPSVFARELVSVGSIFFIIFFGIILSALGVVRFVRKLRTV